MLFQKTFLGALLLLAGCGGKEPQVALTWEVDNKEAVLFYAPASAIGDVQVRVVGNRALYRLPLPHRPKTDEPAVPTVPGGHGRLTHGPDVDALELDFPWLLPVASKLKDTVIASLRLTVTGGSHVEKRIDSGLTLLSGDSYAIDGARRWWVLRLKPDQLYRLKLKAAGPKLHDTQPLADMGRDACAALGIGGALALDGEWLARPADGHVSLVLPRRGAPRLERLAWHGEVQTPLLKLPIAKLNEAPSDGDACAVTTARWDGPASFAGRQATAVPGHPWMVHHSVRLDGPPAVVLRTEPDIGEASVIGGGPRLVHDGKVAVAWREEHFSADFAGQSTARAAAGVTEDGDLLLAWGEGAPPYSRGYTLAEWAEVLRGAGAVEALNVDGSKVSGLVIGGHVAGHLAGADAAPAALLVSEP
jgi:hypothetical protein